MFPPNPLAFWQDFARVQRVSEFVFAPPLALRKDQAMRIATFVAGLRDVDCYPFPPCRSGSQRARPDFFPRLRRCSAEAELSRKIRFEFAVESVHSAGRTKNQRGSSPCVKPLSLLLLQRSRLPVASSPIRPQPVQVWARCLVRPLARSAKTKSQNLRLSAARLACWQATRACAADLAQTSEFTKTASRGTPSAGRSHFRFCVSGPAQASRGREPCSRKS